MVSLLENLSPTRGILVSDFDGTLSRPEFYKIVRDRLLPPETPDFWSQYSAGELSHFDALKGYFEWAEGGEEALLGVVAEIELPENLPELLERLRRAGWQLIVVSAGCSWYIDRLLDRAGVQVPVITNPGEVVGGRLTMHRPTGSEFYTFDTGVDKAAVVRTLQQRGFKVAYAGDGSPDLEASQEVPAELRFARRELAEIFRSRDVPFEQYEVWREIVDALTAEPPE